jgi:acetyl-CoA carboxylase carboxyl transferase subunit beta
MNWLANITPPGVKKIFDKRADTPDNLWIKAPDTGELLYKSDLEATHWVTPSGLHLRIGPEQRFRYLFDEAAYAVIATPPVVTDPLKFKDDRTYAQRLRASRDKTGREDAMSIAAGRIVDNPAVVLVQDFAFMGGSLGMAAGEAFMRAAQEALQREAALICVTASGGARMQEGILSLMQMPRTTLAIQQLKERRLPYIVILTDPTTGGVTASYAMLGDVHIAEPGALIGFAGQRVIEQTIRQKLPEGFQRAEYLRERGMIDIVLDRRRHRETLGRILSVLMANRKAPSAA